ncbi:MAG: dihydropteroate synthase [Lachnospiraceae bacterium]|nr:dihydropteroate synthase [Lachnospiraceae bacterium]
MRIRNTDFDFAKTTYVMGILNVTPDSFSDGGLHNSTEDAVRHALEMEAEGAAIIDIGGESTRPGYTGVSEDEELSRVIPVIKALRNETDIPISVDTTKAAVADAAVAAGADIINTVSGLSISTGMLSVAKESGSVLVMTYENSYVNQFGEALIGMAETAVEAGISADRIIVDPGIGFGKTRDENLRIVNELPLITQIGYPVLLGCSRKSFIRDVLGVEAKDALDGTLVTTVLAALAGVGIVRVHDVKENVRVVKMLSAVVNSAV